MFDNSLAVVMDSAEIKALFNCADASVRTYRYRLKSLLNLLVSKQFVPENLKIEKGCFNQQRIENIVTVIDESKYASNTKLAFLKIVLMLTTNAEDEEILKKKMFHYESTYLHEEKPAIPSLLEFKEVIDLLPENSKEKALMMLYVEVPVRDDLQLQTVFSGETVPAQGNLLFVENPMRVLIRATKNIKSSGQRSYILSKPLTEQLINYIMHIPRHQRRWPFGHCKLYKFVGRTLDDLGFKKGNRSSINLIRQIVATDAENASVEEIGNIAYKSIHSVQKAAQYVRQIEKDNPC